MHLSPGPANLSSTSRSCLGATLDQQSLCEDGQQQQPVKRDNMAYRGASSTSFRSSSSAMRCMPAELAPKVMNERQICARPSLRSCKNSAHLITTGLTLSSDSQIPSVKTNMLVPSDLLRNGDGSRLLRSLSLHEAKMTLKLAFISVLLRKVRELTSLSRPLGVRQRCLVMSLVKYSSMLAG